jgi:AraC-like DNA-binding protein/quercetin dioxygenase-like cupin family protein
MPLPDSPARRQRTKPLPADAQPFAPTATRPLRVRARRLAADTQIAPHSHAWAQVAYSLTGVMRVTADSQTYLVPPSRAVWIPPTVEHVVTVVEDAELRTLYLHLPAGQVAPAGLASSAPLAAGDWRRCRVLEVSALLREAVTELHLLHHPEEQQALPGVPSPGSPASAREALLTALIQDELARARTLPLGVSLPADKRLRRLCEAVLDDPARHGTLEGWSREAGASPRTVARLFRRELGTTFAEWRQQVLLAKALLLVARKRPMSHIAAELGYASPSAFTAMVRRSVGQPPSRFFASTPNG